MKLSEKSQVTKTIKRGDVYFCSLSNSDDDEMKYNQYLLGKTRPCVIIGNPYLTYPFYHAIPIRSYTDSVLVNKENILPIILEDNFDSVLDFSQTRPVYEKAVRDYIGTIYDEKILMEIERKLIENYGIGEHIIYLNFETFEYKNETYETMRKVTNAILDGMRNGKQVSVQVSYLDEREEPKMSEYGIKRVKRNKDKNDYKNWNEEEMREFLIFNNLGIASVEQLKIEGYNFDSIYEVKRCIWYCKHKLGLK